MKNKLKILSELTKIRITFFVTVTTALGYIAAKGNVDIGLIYVSIGILLLACGSAVVNHIQERETDALMDRTKNRPIPSGRISVNNTLQLAILLLITGTIILFIQSGTLTLGLALLNLIWYNVIYTPLKRKSALAIIPGALVGAIPPAVGWVAAGGNLFDPQIIVISFFFFIWQIPHFWLLLLVLDNDYKQAGFPTLTEIFDHNQLARITMIWMIATVVTGLLIPLFGVIKLTVINLALFLSGFWLIWNAVKLIKKSEKSISFRFAFREINLFALLVVLLVSIDKLII